MSRYGYEFDGADIVEVIRQENIRAKSTDVLARVFEQISGQVASSTGEVIFERTPVLPSNCRLYWRDNRAEYYVVEVKPGRFPFKWSGWYHEDTDTNIDEGEAEVAMPWQYFVFNFIRNEEPNPYNIEAHFENLKVFWANERLQDMSSHVYVPFIPNVDSTYTICLGDVYPNSTDPTWQRIEETVNNFYESYFNGDLGWDVPYFWKFDPDQSVLMIREWEKLSKRDILVWRDWPVGTYHHSQALRYFMAYDPQPSRVRNQFSTGGLYSMLYEAIRQSRSNEW